MQQNRYYFNVNTTVPVKLKIIKRKQNGNKRNVDYQKKKKKLTSQTFGLE